MSPSLHRPNSGLTFIEVMVVLTILSVLLAVCVPALISARENSRQARCAGNLRQIGIAVEMYRNNHDGYYPPVGEESGDGRVRYWFGTITGLLYHGADRSSIRADGYLFPYLANPRVLLCPSTQRQEDMWWFDRPVSGYGYNSQYLGTEYVARYILLGDPVGPRPAHRLARPEETAMFGDCALLASPGGRAGLKESYDLLPPSLAPARTHFRHKGKANILLCDGHVQAFSPDGPVVDGFALGSFSFDDTFFDRN